MSLYTPQPLTELELAAMLAPTSALLGIELETCSEDELLMLMAHHEHRSSRESIQRQLSSLTAPYYNPSRPPKGEDLQQFNDWQRDYDELLLQMVQEDCCFHLPLDSEFGEQMKARPLAHWAGAPGLDWHSMGMMTGKEARSG